MMAHMAHGLIPNPAMLIAAGQHVDTRRRPGDVKSIMIDNIAVGDRLRPINPDKVQRITESIRELGLLQPIGVKFRNGQPFLLIYGRHRLEAKMVLRESDPTQDVVAAVIYPEEMPDWACDLAEIGENLHRNELSPKERDAHTAIYAGLLKQNGSVTDAKKASGKTRSSGDGRSLVLSISTVTGKTAADLGITDQAVRKRIKNASKLAARNGVTVDKPTPEKMSGEKLIEVGQAALKAAEDDRAQAAKTGKSHRYVKPQEPLKPTSATVRLDVADPQPFINWCRNRIAGKHKPMSIDILKSYAAALASLIAEVEQSP